MKRPSVHAMEGCDRFEKPPAGDTLFERGADVDALAAMHHALEYFPTPPWAVRALMGLLPHLTGAPGVVLEPACGRGHIMAPLREMGFNVHGCDIHDHGIGAKLGDFTDPDWVELLGAWAEHLPNGLQMVITNPPFGLAETFIRNGLMLSSDVFVLCRLSFLCAGGRCALHSEHLQAVYVFTERPAMVLGRYDPGASTATEYAWFHFKRETCSDWPYPLLIHIPPGTRERCFRREDVRI